MSYTAEERAEDYLRRAAADLAEARRTFAQAFLLYRTQVPTDKQAEAMAQIDHGERVLLAEAAYELAKRT